MDKWLKNISYSLSGKVAAMVALMLLDITAARFLNMTDYAEWVYFFAILTMLFWVGWFGINSSAKVHISRCRSLGEQAACMKSAATLRLLVSILTAVVLYFVLPACADGLGYPDKYPNLRWLFAMSAILVFLNSFTDFFKEIFMGTDQFKNLFVITAVEYTGYFVFSFAGLLVLADVKAIVYGYLLSGVAVAVTGWFLITRNYGTRLATAKVSFRRYMLPVFKYAVPMAFISLGGMILVEMDTFMLGLLGTKADVAVYGIAKNLCSKATHLNYALTVGVMTSFSVITDENFEQKKADFKKAVKINYFITAVVVTGFFLLGPTAVTVLYGGQYVRSGYIIKQLTIYYALYGISNFYSSFLDFRNKAGARSIWYASVAIINLLFNYFWIPEYGAKGAAWATDLSLVPYTVYVVVVSHAEWKNRDGFRSGWQKKERG